MTALAYSPELTTEIPWWVWDRLQDKRQNFVHWITGGLGSAKTTNLALWHLQRCFDNWQSPVSWIVAPTYLKIENVFIPAFIDAAKRHFGMEEGVHYDITTSKQVEIFIRCTGQRIIGHSALKSHLMVGESISHFSATEVGYYTKPEWFEKCKQRLRCPKAVIRQGMGEGTPEGDGKFRDLADFEGEDLDRKFTRTILWSDDNPHLPEGYIEDNILKPLAHDPVKLESYRYGRFVSFNRGTAYWEFFYSRNTTLDVIASPQLPLILSWDFQRTPLSWVALQKQVYNDKYGRRSARFVALGESSGDARGLFDGCVEFAAQFSPELYRDTPIEIYGGADGYAERHNTPSCDFDQIAQYLQKLGFRNVTICAATSAPRIQTRLERTNALFAYEQYVVARWLRNMISGYERACLKPGVWKLEKPTGQGKDPTHYPDAADYALFQLTKDEELGQPLKPRFKGMNAGF